MNLDNICLVNVGKKCYCDIFVSGYNDLLL